jgi:hypothetical protein
MHRTASSFRPCVEKLEDRTVPSNTALTVSPNPAIAGQSITLSALVTANLSDFVQPGGGFPPGQVTFFDGAAPLKTVVVTPSSSNLRQGSAQLTTSSLGVGTHSLIAKYSGDDVILGGSTAGSTSNTVSEVVNPELAADVTSLTRVTVRRLPGNEALVLVKNKSGQTIGGLLYLEITGLPKTVHLLGKHGTIHAHKPKGSPFVTDNVTLGPGGFVGFLLQFSGNANFGVRVLAGPGAV